MPASQTCTPGQLHTWTGFKVTCDTPPSQGCNLNVVLATLLYVSVFISLTSLVSINVQLNFKPKFFLLVCSDGNKGFFLVTFLYIALSVARTIRHIASSPHQASSTHRHIASSHRATQQYGPDPAMLLFAEYKTLLVLVNI